MTKTTATTKPVPRFQCTECLELSVVGSNQLVHQPTCSFTDPATPMPPFRIVTEVPGAELKRLRSRLATLEWAGSTYGDERCCPVTECGVIFTGLHPPSHAPDCWLAEAIGAERDG